jgi:AhpD family alkylhydroperoxidase
MPKLIEYKDMAPRAKAVVEGIAQARGIEPAAINNVWKALARHPAVMERFAAEMKAAFALGKLDPLTKELVYLAVSITNQCDYCIASHSAMARAKGMTEEMHEEFMSAVLAAQKGNKITTAYRVPVDAAFEEK